MIPVMGRMWMPLMSYGRNDLNIARTAKGSLVLTGHAPSIFVPYTAATGLGELTISGKAPVIGVNTPVSAGVGSLSLTGHAPSVSATVCGTSANTLLLFDGSDGSTTITDDGSVTGTWTCYGTGTEIDTAEYPTGMSSSLWLPGGATTKCQAAADSDQNILDLTEFTVEAWVYLYDAPPSAGHVIASKWYSTTGGWEFRINNARNIGFAFPYQHPGILGAQQVPIGEWVHVCATRTAKGSTNGMHVGVNGVILSGTSFNHSVNEPASSQLTVGAGYESSITSNGWHGWISNFRVTRGCARYRAYTVGDTYYYDVPTLPLPIP